jgi:hypothetical protein
LLATQAIQTIRSWLNATKNRHMCVRAYCIELTEITRRLYGDALYGVIASIATKVLNKTVTKASVRYWCEDKGP